MEIERKFLFHKLPDQLDTYPHYGIEQAYVTTNPVIRVRKKTLIRRSICSLRLPICPDCQKQWYVSQTGI